VSDQAPKYFFVHVMKTAGGTLRRHIVAIHERDRVYPSDPPDGDMFEANTRIDRLRSLSPERRRRVQVFTGHFPFFAVEVLELDLTTFTILRDPVERTISYLRARKANHPEHRDMRLEEIYEDPFHFPCLIRDHQAKIFALRPDDGAESYMHVIDVDDERLALAKANLERVDVIGLQERFGEMLRELEARFGWRFGSVEDKNVGGRGAVPDSFRRRIAEDNGADMEFYEFARELYASRARDRSPA
jgi:hypothetical protein